MSRDIFAIFIPLNCRALNWLRWIDVESPLTLRFQKYFHFIKVMSSDEQNGIKNADLQ
jgi:hypothetical protein